MADYSGAYRSDSVDDLRAEVRSLRSRIERMESQQKVDPPKPSLRDEVRDAISDMIDRDIIPIDITDAILAIWRRHVEALPHPAATPTAVYMDDVLRLLGASDD